MSKKRKQKRSRLQKKEKPTFEKNSVRLAAAYSALLLGIAWLLFSAWRPATYVLTPFLGKKPVAPLYAFNIPAVTPWIVAALLAIIGCALLAARMQRTPKILFLPLAMLLASALNLSIHAARSSTLPGQELAFYKGEEIIEDARNATSASDFLRTYTEKQPQLSLHGRTKPPGFALFYRALFTIFPDRLPLLGSIITLLSSLLVLPVYFLSRLLDGDESHARISALLAATAPPAILFGAVSLDAIFAVAASIAFALAAWEIKRPALAKRLALGGMLFLTLMLSYSGFLVGLLCTCWLGLDRRHHLKLLIRDAVQMALGLLLPFLLLYWSFGFNAWTCFINARQLNTAAMTAVLGKPIGSFAVWSYASVGNLLAWTIILGPVLIGLLVRVRWVELHGPTRTMAIASGVALTVACFGGIYLIETERIFLFFLPVIAALAARCRDFSLRESLALSAGTALLFELALFTLW